MRSRSKRFRQKEKVDPDIASEKGIVWKILLVKLNSNAY
jgi:hypothetical protein